MNCPRWEKPVWITQIQAPTGRGQWHPTPVLLPGKSHGQRSLVGCSPWGHTESDTTERLHFGFSLSCTGEGNGNPLQCSCLEDPRDRGAWWAAIYRVAQSQTQLKWLNSSSKLPHVFMQQAQTMGGRVTSDTDSSQVLRSWELWLKPSCSSTQL